jgi:gamma-glutamyl-gamma-aminobutyrate hydrolase PuuD
MIRAALVFRNEKKVGPYRNALLNAGIEPLLVTPENPIESLDGMGLVLAGGTDVDPQLYGQEKDPLGDSPDRERDDFELRLLGEALELDRPVLAICRGLQLFNVAHRGGTLVQHIEGHRLENNGTHIAEISDNTRLATILGAGELEVNSRHHQAAAQIGEGLIVSVKSSDGVIEGLERSDLRFALAVQWHPEDMLAGHPEQAKLFFALREALQK